MSRTRASRTSGTSRTSRTSQSTSSFHSEPHMEQPPQRREKVPVNYHCVALQSGALVALKTYHRARAHMKGELHSTIRFSFDNMALMGEVFNYLVADVVADIGKRAPGQSVMEIVKLCQAEEQRINEIKSLGFSRTVKPRDFPSSASSRSTGMSSSRSRGSSTSRQSTKTSVSTMRSQSGSMTASNSSMRGPSAPAPKGRKVKRSHARSNRR